MSTRKINPYEVFSYVYGEPKSSPVPNGDYEFATARYPKSNFRHAFVEKYISHIVGETGERIYNCRFEKPRKEINLIHFYIYKHIREGDIVGRIKSPDNYYVKAFYDVLEQVPAGGITRETKLTMFVRDIDLVLQSYVIDKSIIHMNEVLLSGYPFEECYGATYWDKMVYVFIKGRYYDSLINNPERLEEIKNYCFKIAKAYDNDKVFTMENFFIRIENYDVFKEMGGYNYFNSEQMSRCIKI